MGKGTTCTLIMVKRVMTETRMALAGVIPERSFARFKAVMAAFNDEREGCLDVSVAGTLHP